MSKFRTEYCEDSNDYLVYWDNVYIGDIISHVFEVGTHEAKFVSDGEYIPSEALRAMADFIDKLESEYGISK